MRIKKERKALGKMRDWEAMRTLLFELVERELNKKRTSPAIVEAITGLYRALMTN
jgi:hypothetical protein